MSKKDRLKEQGEKQLIAMREAQEQERFEKEEARQKQSKAAKKMRRKAKQVRVGGEPIFMLLIKLLMIVPFAYSGFFWGGVTVVAMFGGQYMVNEPPAWVGYVMLAGMIVMLAGIIFAFFKKYIVQFILCTVGAGGFLKAGQWFINTIQQQLATKKVDEELKTLDVEFMWRYYPIAALIGLSFVLLVAGIILYIIRKKNAQKIRDNAPVESIVPE